MDARGERGGRGHLTNRHAILKPPTSPLILDDAGTVAHVWWKGGVIASLVGPAWTQNGTVPQVPRSGRTPAGSGPFSGTQYYSLGTGNDVLDFAGNFWGAVVFNPSSIAATTNLLLLDGSFGGTGWYVQMGSGSAADGKATFVTSNTTNSVLSVANANIVGAVNVICFGRVGTTNYLKSNLGAIVSAASAPYAAATTVVPRIGLYATGTNPFPGTIYECTASGSSPGASQAEVDTFFTAIAARVKSRAGVSAW